MTKKSKKIIGIDLGTTNSCVSIFDGNEVVVISNSEGRRTTPSIFAMTKDGESKIGDPAKRQAVTNPKNTIYSVKRFMGKDYEQVKSIIPSFPYDIVNSNNRPGIKLGDNVYSPEEISARIIQKMKKTAEDYLGETVEFAVITVPAYFNDAERQATKLAGELAGLEVKRIINEPTAAALAYGIDKKKDDMTIVVFDCGGGTHDVSILEFGDGVFEVKATDGDVNLGGDNFDDAIINWIADEFLKDENVDLRKDPMALSRVKEAAEKAKIELSSSTQTEINLPYIMPVDGVPKHFVKTLSRATFEKLVDELVQRTIIPAKNCLKAANIDASKVDEVILVGGSTRIPKIQEEVEKLFGKKPSKNVNPDEVVAIGAAVQGAVLTGEVEDVLLLDVTSMSYGIETMGGVFTKLLEANTTIPCKKTEVFSTAVDNQPSVEIHVLQGERPKASDNRSLGKFHLSDIPPAKRGEPKIEVTLNIDANSILTVSAKDLGTGKEQNIRIENSNSLSTEEIERMKADAKANEEADRKFKEEIDKLNAVDSLIFTSEKSLNEYGDKVKPETKEQANALITELKTAKEKKDFTTIESKSVELQAVLSKFYEEIQSNDVDSTTSTNTEPTASSDDGVTDVPYEEVK